MADQPCMKKRVEKTEDAIKNGQSKGNGSIGHERHRTETKAARNKINKQTYNNITQNKKDEEHGSHQNKLGMNPVSREQ